jgi:energy-coupling factor transporter ATPase
MPTETDPPRSLGAPGSFFLSFIRIERLAHTYTLGDSDPIPALRGIDLEIDAGEYVAIVGANGSGKTTLARHLNALLLPTSGNVWVNGLNTRDRDATYAIRSQVGMVFQSPPDQLVATVVEEDVAFGPENLGVPEIELAERVRHALCQVGMWPFRYRAPHLLSAGQQQRVAIAGAIAMDPRCLVLDEATAMLDPIGRRDLLRIVGDLNHAGITAISITHDMQEATRARRVVVMHEGQVALDGSPAEIFSCPHLGTFGLAAPPAVELARRLRQRLPDLPQDILTAEALAQAVAERMR